MPLCQRLTNRSSGPAEHPPWPPQSLQRGSPLNFAVRHHGRQTPRRNRSGVHAQANDSECRSRSALLTQHLGRPVACYCGAELTNIEVTLPKGLVLGRACNLRFPDGRSPDIRKERISLDKYDSSGNTLDGEFLLRGELHLTGYVRYEPSNGGDLWFRPSVPVLKQQTAFEPNFRFFALRQESAYSKFRLSKRLRANSMCTQAKAEVAFRGFKVLVNESEEAGISPLNIEVKGVSDFSACKWGE